VSAPAALRRARFRSRILRAPVVTVRHRHLEPADALLVSYPRSGTTWLRFLLTQALTGEPADFHPDRQAVRYVGDHADAPRIVPGGGRLIYSHERRSAGDRAVLYIVRDPRAVAVSEWRWLERRGLADRDFGAFLARFVRGRSNPWGRWDEHVRWWLDSSEPSRSGRTRLTRFEDLRSQTQSTLAELVTFMGANAAPDRIEAAVRDNSLERMQEKESEAPDRAFAKGVRRDVRFVRSGSVGGWREALSPGQQVRIADAFGPVMQQLGYDPAPAVTDAGSTG
jgi:hypothetical protein